MSIKARDLVCQKVCGGKKPLWHAYRAGTFNQFPNHMIVGAGNTADNAIRDYQKQSRVRSLRVIPGVI